jgi:phospholipid transport system transporter-binding protein
MISCEGGQCVLEGPITLTNVTTVLEDGKRAFREPEVVVDLARVTEVDSAAVSLLLEWQRECRARNCRVVYVNLPSSLKTLADLYGVSDLIAVR